ncbi:hypothetical protein CC86DRAFT_442459 [Ophiobolus disseminans]|uniref:N-acetyltransferase domain-containing protein n=1 Tax=Ophiobolus disseminans TaxID=1469910 RepID=A0A6A7AFM1_9PLEO|nr:hypothetical protein CC86DRAFT_442459 [Ophiobolus disseminans]
MKINEHKAVFGPRVLLVPYCSHHVPTYHEWMQDEEIQKATASEPLTLDEEHSMQQSWRLDHDKLTFIVCHAPATQQLDQIKPKTLDTPDQMIGDVNLFLYEHEDENDEENSTDAEIGTAPIIGELEIMIASKSARGKGLAHETLLAFLSYITIHLPAILEEYRAGSDERSERYLKYLRVKIDQHNGKSIALFERVGFSKVGEKANYFGEVEMRVDVVEAKFTDRRKRQSA